MKWRVTAQAYDYATGKKVGPKRSEVVDTTEEDGLFENCKTAYDVKCVYEGFWNQNCEEREAGEFVCVLAIELLDTLN